MLLFLSEYKQRIAWFFVNLFTVALVLTPSAGRAMPVNSRFHQLSYGINDWKNDLSPNNRFEFLPAGNYASTRSPHKASAKKEAAFNVKTSGPGQPEMQAFSSVSNSNMVDLFSGDFAYNIPLMDVGGYPVNLSYRGGVSMDQEASWVGLGWSVNPGTINRNMRGLPDDFDGTHDSIKKTLNIRENKTVGVTAGAGAELVGVPLNLSISAGVFHNNYKGWGLEYGVNASLNAGTGAAGSSTAGLSVTNNTQEGVTIAPSFSITAAQLNATETSSLSGVVAGSLPYNSRSGLKGLQLSTGLRQYFSDGRNQQSLDFSSVISFASPSYTPLITIPFTSRQFSFTAKVGGLKKVLVNNFSISGYVSSQKIEKADTSLSLPAFGYLNYQNAENRPNSLLDFNLEKDIPYREKPPVPHIAVPSYTYDAFSITGEGTGGMFRAYRSDIGFVHDHSMRTRDISDRASIDVAVGDIVHAGVDLNVNRAYSQNGPWLDNNTLRKIIGFKRDTADFQASFFRNPSEKSINSKSFYESLGGDDVVAVNLYQPSRTSSYIQATNYLSRYRNKKFVENKLLRDDSTYKSKRDKRTQVISYLTAKEADAGGLSRYIDNYRTNTFGLLSCGQEISPEGDGTGLPGDYYGGAEFENYLGHRTDTVINFPNTSPNISTVTGLQNEFSVRWQGRLKAPETGKYTFQLLSDDGARLYFNDSSRVDWSEHPVDASKKDSITLNLLANEFYTIKIEYQEQQDKSDIIFNWRLPSEQGSSSFSVVPKRYLYGPGADTFAVGNLLVKEKRVNSFRKPNHISEVSVLNNDGKRYIYGIPVYSLKQKETTFAVGQLKSRADRGMVAYTDQDNSTDNQHGLDRYYGSEEIPSYAQSFLLTGILSPDYVDATGNGITDDDRGDAVKFNYSKISGITNPFKWRTPYVKDSANYNEGLKTDTSDDKGSILYGEKELWYLHSIESKTMIATFITEPRKDLLPINEHGAKQNLSAAQRLTRIDLYSKADFARKGTAATPIKTVHFEYSYELCKGINKDIGSDSGKLTLKKVWFTYNKNNKGKLNPYLFYYNNNPDYAVKSYDRWGNYKKATDNPSNAGVVPNDEYPYAIQDSAVAAVNAGAWSLDSIALPSGGSIKAEFESDDYAYVQDNRAMQMVKPLGFGMTAGMTSGYLGHLYDEGNDYQYVYFSLPHSVTNKQDFYKRYVQGIQKLYFRIFVAMPADQYGSGSEYVSGYADLDPVNGYGISTSTVGWVKVSGISLKGDGPGSFSPMAKAAIQFLRLNLPSKAYPYSSPGDNLSTTSAVKMVLASFGEIANAFSSFDRIARSRAWAQAVDLNKSYFRLDNPNYFKYGGGHRVKKIKIYDNWDRMTGRRAAVYGQEYTYTTQKEINGVTTTISSGVASYEPGIGGEENPFRQPIEYVDKSSILGPVTLGYSEEPLGESFFPSASVGYSKVRVRTINHSNTRSANGVEETQFYTSYDFPTYTDRSVLDDNTKKRFKPSLANFLRINARHHMVISQGFKIELNDMNGKLRSQASYAETDLAHPFSYTENVYKTEDNTAEHKRLSNTVQAIDAAGNIDTTALIGKDVELMVAMREQQSVSTGANVNTNVDVFSIPFIPGFFVIPSIIPLYQREENIFRSSAITKVIQRYGIIDHVIHVDKGSQVITKDLLYDSETGDVLISQTQNEFNDPVYNFTYPSHWAYDGMGLAYKNIGVTFAHVNIRQGRIIGGLTNETKYFSSGDEIWVAGRLQTDQPTECSLEFSSFPSFSKIWVINGNVIRGGDPKLYFINQNGTPYSGYDMTMKVVRSGRRNMLASVGSVTSLVNPLRYNGSNQLVLQLDTASQVLNASAGEFNQLWKVDDEKAPAYGQLVTNCREILGPKGISKTVCDTTYGQGCFSLLSDTTINPYVAGILGNWRLNRSYSYFGPRAQSDASSQTNIRTDGNFADFNPFWKFQSSVLQAQYNPGRWVWNSETTLFNRKGFEIENKDPLGRYNSGLYGYNQTMPVAVIQNSKYRESGFDGFEDYNFNTNLCDTACEMNRQFDFTAYKGLVDSTRSHSGKKSLRLTGENNVATLSVPVTFDEPDTIPPGITFTTSDACLFTFLHDVHVSRNSILQAFSPSEGSKMVLSAWVREDQNCKCNSYANNRITINADGNPKDLRPSGSIIEGWQRYECVFTVGGGGTVNIALHADNNISVNFDDIRIHPYNANMKSYVFHPINLRLMAELDENNYATFYEYDDDGTLIRLKKETQHGIKTIKETRSALLKE